MYGVRQIRHDKVCIYSLFDFIYNYIVTDMINCL